MTRRARVETILVLALGAGLAGSSLVNITAFRRLAVVERQRAADLESLRKLQEALRERPVQTASPEVENPTPVDAHRAALAQRAAIIDTQNRELSEARASIKDLQAQLAKATDEHEKAVADANARHEKEQADWQSQLGNLKQQLDAVQTESQASRERLAAVEADNAKLRNENKEGSSRAADSQRLVASLEELDRRRDAYLTSILRRYRDITSQFRAMSGMLDAGRDTNSTNLSGEALTRIQNAIAQADDDLRQLSELNAQARQLEKKLEKK